MSGDPRPPQPERQQGESAATPGPLVIPLDNLCGCEVGELTLAEGITYRYAVLLAFKTPAELKALSFADLFDAVERNQAQSEGR